MTPSPIRSRIRVRRPAGAPFAVPPLVSVVIPCHNYARYLPAAIDSVLSQRSADVEVIVVDDASTDDSAEVAAAYARRTERVRLLRHHQNAGPVDTFNDGLEQARGEFLVRLDADDLLTPGSLERALWVARSFPGVGLVYGHPLHFSGSSLPAHREAVTAWTIWTGQRWLEDRCRSGFNVITSPEVLMRMSVVRTVGGQKPLAHTHDMEMWLRLAAFSDVAYVHGADQAWHREHPQSLSARKVDGYRDMIERHLAFETLFSGIAGSKPEVAQLRPRAMAAVASSALGSVIHCYDHGIGGSELSERYLDFARSIVPDVTALPEWRRLARRASADPKHTSRNPLVFLDRVAHRLGDGWRWRRWHRDGVF